MSEQEIIEEENGGIITCSPEFYDAIEDFSKHFKHRAALREAARFSMSIGIITNSREEKKDWKKGKPRTIAHLHGQFNDDGKFDYSMLFEMLDILDKQVPLNQLISEYVTGGMRWVVQNEMVDGNNFSILKTEFPHLFED